MSDAPSPGAEALRNLYADWSAVMAGRPDLDIRLLRSLFDEWHQATAEPTDVTYADDVVGGVPGLWALPVGADRGRVVLFTHGGGFAVGSAASHRKLAGHLAKALGTTAFVLDYRRAPEHPHPAQVDDGVAAFDGLLERGIAAADVVTAGDSAGGNLAIAIPLALRERGRPLPGAVVAFSPWLDMANTGKTLESNADTDALVTVPLLAGMIAGVLGDTGDGPAVHPATPLANPLHADLTGFPPVFVDAGGAEVLLDDAIRFTERARLAGVDATLSGVDGRPHGFPVAGGRGGGAGAALAAIAEWYRSRRAGVAA